MLTIQVELAASDDDDATGSPPGTRGAHGQRPHELRS